MKLPLTSGKTVTVVAHPHLRTLVDNITDILASLASIFFIFVGVAPGLAYPWLTSRQPAVAGVPTL